MPPPPDMAYWLGQKYSILGKQAEGEYQRNVAEAYKSREEGGQVAPNAASMRALQGAQAGLYGEEATGLRADRYLSDDWFRQAYQRMFGGGGLGGLGGPGGQGGQPGQQQQPGQPQQPQQQDQQQPQSPKTNPVTIYRGVPGQRGYQPPQTYQVDPFLSTDPGKALPQIKPNSPPVYDPNQPVLPLKPQQSGSLDWSTDTQPLRKGSANVKAKGAPSGKGGKSAGKGGGGGAPQELEAILPALMAASQGGGAAGPQAPDGSPPFMAPSAAAPATQPPGFAKGTASVQGRGLCHCEGGGAAPGFAEGTSNVSSFIGSEYCQNPATFAFDPRCNPQLVQNPGPYAKSAPLTPPTSPSISPSNQTPPISPSNQTPPLPGIGTQLVPSQVGPAFSTRGTGNLVVPPRGSTVIPYSGMPGADQQKVLDSGYTFAKGTPDVKKPPAKDKENGKSADKGKAPDKTPGKAKAKAKSKSPPSGDLHRGLAAILPQLLAAAQGGSGGPPMGGGAPPGPPMGAPPPGPPQPPGMATGMANVGPMMDPRSAHSAPGYPFGAGYLFGATAVPGQGSGTVDKVPAMLAPHEAVLNRAAADILGRGKIAALNAQGVQRMGLGRGVR